LTQDYLLTQSILKALRNKQREPVDGVRLCSGAEAVRYRIGGDDDTSGWKERNRKRRRRSGE
jgi:hypothetical protein